jgi:RNA polymerase sigma-70 factor (ECF subfamily)
MDLEARICALRDAGDLNGAATQAIEGYGPEVLGFLVTLMRDEGDAGDVFAQASEDLWAGLARFEGRSSMRTWFYVLARHAAARFHRSPHKRHGRQMPLSAATGVAERVRTRTSPFLRTDMKDKFAVLRDALNPEDRALLVLRVDRNMSWNEIARVLAPGESEAESGLSRAAARMRKRFQLVKDDIRARAIQAGLLRGDES